MSFVAVILSADEVTGIPRCIPARSHNEEITRAKGNGVTFYATNRQDRRRR